MDVKPKSLTDDDDYYNLSEEERNQRLTDELMEEIRAVHVAKQLERRKRAPIPRRAHEDLLINPATGKKYDREGASTSTKTNATGIDGDVDGDGAANGTATNGDDDDDDGYWNDDDDIYLYDKYELEQLMSEESRKEIYDIISGVYDDDGAKKDGANGKDNNAKENPQGQTNETPKVSNNRDGKKSDNETRYYRSLDDMFKAQKLATENKDKNDDDGKSDEWGLNEEAYLAFLNERYTFDCGSNDDFKAFLDLVNEPDKETDKEADKEADKEGDEAANEEAKVEKKVEEDDKNAEKVEQNGDEKDEQNGEDEENN